MISRTSIASLLVGAFVLSADGVDAQTPPQSPLSVGARVRAWVPAAGRRDGWLVGTVADVAREGIEIREASSGKSWNVPFAGARLEVSRGIESASYGGVAGAVGGFLLGELAGLLIAQPTSGESSELGRKALELLGTPEALLAGAAGAVAGYFIGRRIRSERWERVTLPTDVGVGASGRGVLVRLTWGR
jgi:hypothetical protein